MEIRPASVEDAKQITEILQAGDLHHHDITPSHLQHFIVLHANTQIIGVVGLEVKHNCALLRSLAVNKAYQKRGHATQLVNKIETYAKVLQIDTLYLLTMTAEGFFAKRGYQKTDRNSAPPSLQETTEFKNLCPASAVCMKKHI
jgi:amino-acid N-acetyltransferase